MNFLFKQPRIIVNFLHFSFTLLVYFVSVYAQLAMCCHLFVRLLHGCINQQEAKLLLG